VAEIKDTYLTIQKPSEGIFKDKGSKFLAFAFPVDNEVEIKNHLATLKKKYFDARHQCYAYAIGIDRQNSRINDDSEPSGTAGKPIMGQILSFGITNILIVVVRYFGGTLLGTSGLINAYKNAAYEALTNAVMIEKVIKKELQIKFNYLVMNEIMTFVKHEKLEFKNQQFNNICSINLLVSESKLSRMIENLKKIDSVQIDQTETN
jgi:uncharacterized YigZ family protein